MSTKTTFKRIALVTVAALSFGLLTSVTPASAASVSLNAVVGPNGATSLTVVGGTDSTTGAIIRLDVASDSATPSTLGLQDGETITASVIGVPTSVTAKTLAANGGSLADTSTATGSDFVMLEVKPALVSSGNVGTAAASTTAYNARAFEVTSTRLGGGGDLESFTAQSRATANTNTTDGQLGGYGTQGASSNTYFQNVDGRKETSATINTVSYYVAIHPRSTATVVDQGVYTIQFQLTDANGAVRGTKTVKVDFVSTAAKSDATLALGTSGTFLAGAALATSDSTSATYATVTLRNRDGGLVRMNDGTMPIGSGTNSLSVKMQTSTTDVPVYTDTNTAGTTRLNISDTGTLGADFGTSTQGVGTLVPGDGVYGIQATNLPFIKSSSTTGSVQLYRIEAAFGNAPIQTTAITVYAASGSGTAAAGNTDALVTADGMSAADQLRISNDSDAAYTWTLPTSTKTATVKFYIQTSADTATPAAAITVTPTWSGSFGTASVSPATSTTGTTYTTDSNGNFSVTVTNDAPVSGASVALVLSGGAAFGGGTYTATLTWAKPAASTIAVADPVTGTYVKTGSTNVTTVIVKDQFGTPVSGQSVSVTLGSTSANYSATTAIAPITTGANGTATYSLVGGATDATFDTITFACVPTACANTVSGTNVITYTYKTTVPTVATLAAYHNLDWNTTAVSGTLTPSTGIYSSGTTKLVLQNARDLSKSLAAFADSTTDDMISLAFYALATGSVAAQGAVVTVTAGDGAWLLDSSGLPAKSRNYAVGSTGWTANIQAMATKTGAVTFTATSGTVSATASLWVDNGTLGSAARFVTITGASTGTANGTGVPVTVAVTDRYGNPVSGVALNVVASGVGSFMGGAITNSFTTDAAGTYTFLANTAVSEGGVAKFTVTSGTSSDMSSAAGYVAATAVDATLAAGNSTASASITFAAGSSATDVAQAATDAAAEATDAANAATDAANAAAEAADAATAAAQDAADAVAALSAQVATLISGLKSQLTALTNLVIKIQKKVKA